ncbi:ATP synthase F1 subunit delta [Lentiprolixibacter aurantiacus]|uniref:ATP synthase subunit delta n=1 Tax=Lentiprolixibacter aurantiacus TaxID=2993939 RepID=A0AAE3SMH0_9FLAO|nr:ATP synthase F1 subunit delta [Lentiprolixibacter aurantiacus]MCX2718574.1 ATP synthase F1 subunit delta [Lentiprolixibacter aurantiacus]
MSDSRAAVRYAKAILDLAIDKKADADLENDMRLVVSTIQENGELKDVLGSPVISGEVKKSILSGVFKDIHELGHGLIELLIDKKRISLLSEVAAQYVRLHEEFKGERVAYVTTAVPLNKSLQDRLLQQVEKITGDKVTLENQVDENVLGGFVLRVGDLQYNASIANKLEKLKREFTNSI